MHCDQKPSINWTEYKLAERASKWIKIKNKGQEYTHKKNGAQSGQKIQCQ